MCSEGFAVKVQSVKRHACSPLTHGKLVLLSRKCMDTWIKKCLAALLLGVGLVNGAWALAWTGPREVVSVQVVETGGFLLEFATPINTACTAAGTNRLYIYSERSGVTADAVKSLLATALTAFATGMKVSVAYDETSPYCWGRYISLTK